MAIPKKEIRSLTRAIYLVAILLMLNFSIVLLYYLKPLSVRTSDPNIENVWKPKSIETDVPDGALGEEIRYGYQIIKHTSKYIGPLAANPEMRFAGNNLTCGNCHLNGGRKIGSGSFIGVANRYPQFRGRENKIGTLEDRINGCMERSMNGKKMPDDSEEMQAMIAYMEWLSDDVPEEVEKLYKGYLSISIPSFKADTTIGRALYIENCAHCHMEDGTGQKKQAGQDREYIYPPIGGSDSYNDGAGMNRVITAAEFIKGNMPYGTNYDEPQVTDEEAYHIAAYINSLPRPQKDNKEQDFPKIELKPVSTPYGPWADEFPPEQHKFGPFPPIISYYYDKYGITKTK